MKQSRHYPTQSEILAIEQAARRAQAAELRRLLALGARKFNESVMRSAKALSDLFAQPRAAAGSRGAEDDRRSAVPGTIIEELARSLPPEVRERYADDLAAAARIEPLITGALAVWNIMMRALAHGFQGVARSLRAAACSLDFAARRLTPTH